MTGLERNRAKLFEHQGSLFVAAFDHPQMYGVMKGLENPVATIDAILDTELDGFILNPGIFPLLGLRHVVKRKIIMRASLGGTMLSKNFADCHHVMVSPQNAIDQGADAILVMLVLGGEHDRDSMIEVARTIDSFHKFAIPVIAEVLAADFTKNNEAGFVRDGVRIAAEIGADAVKAFYCDNFQAVTAGCPVPVILAGGPKDRDIVKVARDAVACGVRGFAFGRNIFQNEDPAGLIRDLNRVLRKGE